MTQLQLKMIDVSITKSPAISLDLGNFITQQSVRLDVSGGQ